MGWKVALEMVLKGGIPSKNGELQQLMKDEFGQMQAMGRGVMGVDARKMVAAGLFKALKAAA